MFSVLIRLYRLFLHRLTFKKIWNLLKLVFAFYTRKKTINAYPVLIKIDTTPQCQLKCPACIHAEDNTGFEHQYFNKSMQISMEMFKQLTDEVSGKTMVFSMYHMGEPLINKNILEMCAYADSKSINTYFTTNFSFNLTDEKLEQIILCGIKSIHVALDGFSQEVYGKTRIGGKIDLVKRNLERLLAIRKRLNRKTPFLEVQSCEYNWNRHEKDQIIEFCNRIGVDALSFIVGDTVNWTITTREYSKRKPTRGWFQNICKWPYFASLVLGNGDVIPCCYYRIGEIYAKNVPRITMGHIRDKRFMDVFAGEAYQVSRSLVFRPRCPVFGAENNFCHSCGRYL